MSDPSALMREQACTIWKAAVAAIDPFMLVQKALTEAVSPLRTAVERHGTPGLVGGGKAGGRRWRPAPRRR